MAAHTRTLRLVLGDQLNRQHSWWQKPDPKITVVFIESRSETDYVVHHIQKVAAFFLAMRAFADELSKQGFDVSYIRLDDPQNSGSITSNLDRLFTAGDFQKFAYQAPDEWRLDQAIANWAAGLKIEVEMVDTEHFYTARSEVKEFFKGKKTYLMESYYRMLRKREGVLMDGEQPAGGKWNYDKSNRKSLPEDERLPEPLVFNHDASDVVKMIEKAGVKTMGTMADNRLLWPIDRNESLALLHRFIEVELPNFGDFQDAMSVDQWAMFHARLSFSMNVKMLSPKEVVDAAEAAWRKDSKKYPLPAVEGFIRQIIGWREYMRGVYWAQMPGYSDENFFDHQSALPEWFWTGKTKMRCMQQAIGQSLDYAYAHHIQRLMITGNFALLLGADPKEVDAWYLGIYIDAIEWVEITNTRGMSQFADGGLVATKPYVSTANYIDKMSDYCKGCHYNAKEKTTDDACPFNALYWDFYHRHRDKLEHNPRIGFVYPTLNKMKGAQLDAILAKAAEIKEKIDGY